MIFFFSFTMSLSFGTVSAVIFGDLHRKQGRMGTNTVFAVGSFKVAVFSIYNHKYRLEVDMRKVFFTIMLIACVYFSLFAKTTEYDIGEGRTLLLYEDGSYEIVSSSIEPDIIVGKQYKLDMVSILEPYIALAILEEPSLSNLDKDYVYSLLKDTGLFDAIMAEIPNISLIFISKEKLLLIADEEKIEAFYRITASRELYFEDSDGAEEKIGKFSDDYSKIVLEFDDTIPIYLVRQE